MNADEDSAARRHRSSWKELRATVRGTSSPILGEERGGGTSLNPDESTDFGRGASTPRARRVRAHDASGAIHEREDALAGEEPLEIRVNGRPVSVTMRTPGEEEELAVGFLLTEGIIAAREDVVAVVPALRRRGCNVYDVRLTPSVHCDFAALTRHVFASSSCGLCGKATIESVHCRFPPVTSPVRVSAAALHAFPDRMRAAQRDFERTGGLHAAALFGADGTMRVLREDVGRHNAVDKVLGRMLLDGLLPLDEHVLLVSGRASFEILQKALAAGLSIVAAVSAPSSLAARFAEESGQTLVGFLREGRFNVYTHPQRILP